MIQYSHTATALHSKVLPVNFCLSTFEITTFIFLLDDLNCCSCYYYLFLRKVNYDVKAAGR